ncbi:type I restriction-modification system subunit M [Ruegeria sp. 2012CJ41-6]|uniref:site-specific DNA-methyltransferase (adenine-specific) n=1 Tax=Ruegeria spongiae TaxID=2942209 RepID=A0ABT0Q357_9RHOB|nr:type I restriction-modification system subunit M [Ruegeria spongiae]MCL6284271.1 type I restriction-modification system subunit M [Ruegeria spongiae]
MTEAQKQRLESQLWKIANELRGKMDADEFRDYILGFIFYKYLSEKQLLFANKLLETEDVKNYQDVTYEEDLEAIKEESLEKLGYFLHPGELFTAITAKGNIKIDEEDEEEVGNFILDDLQEILNAIEQSTMGNESEDDFNKLFEDIDLASTKLGRSPSARNKLIAKVLAHLEKIDFQLGQVDADVLGDAYEYLIGQFASGAGKKAGEFYTPQQVSRVLAKIVTLGKSRIKNAYDPACGSGSLLLRIAKEAEVGEFAGQELNRTTYNLARMNMILHGVHFSQFDIRQEDTLEEPMHLEERFEAVVANPPFSAKWKSGDNPLHETDDRFSQYGRLAPSSKADFAFVQHMIHQLADNGTAAVVLPHGALYRGAAEGIIREYIIKEQNYLDAVIGLPSNLFYGTSIPACILVLKKCRIHDEDILFIDASAEFDKRGNQNFLTDRLVENIVQAYEKRETSEKYAYVAPLSEVAENGYNLNISRYVYPFEEERIIDVSDVTRELRRSSSELETVNRSLEEHSSELEIDPPSGVNVPLLEAYKKACMQGIFSQEIRFKTGAGAPYPDWKPVLFGSLFTWVRTNSLPREKLSADPEGEVQNIHYGDIHTKFRANFKQGDEEVPFIIGSSTEDFRPEDFCLKGDVVIADASEDHADIGKAIEIIEPDETPLVAGLHTYIARPNTTELVVGFPGYLLRSAEARRQIMRVAQGISVLGISKGNLEKISLLLPHVDEQKRIAEFLSCIDTKIDLVSKNL